jgi:hypothetical protein
MAKSKPKSKKILEEEDAVEQAIEDADATSADIDVDVDEELSRVDVDAPPSAVDVDVEAATSGVDVDVDADDEPPQTKKTATGDAEDDEADVDVDVAPKRPTPKVTMTTYILIGLNLLAAPAFLYVLFADHEVHTQHVYRTIYNFTRIYGLPLESEETPASIYAETRSVIRLNAEQLKAAFIGRRTGFSPPGSEPFVAVDESVPMHIRPSDMSEMLLKDVFSEVSNPVKTLDAEIKRIQDTLPGTIETAAKDVVAKTKAEDKRGAIKKILLPIAWDVWQVKRLNDKLDAVKDDALDDMLLDAVQRRIYYDILAPLNIHRAGADDDYKIEKMAAVDSYVMKFKDGDVKLEGYKIDDLKGFLLQRLKAAQAEKYDPEVHLGKRWPSDAASMTRDNNERRHVIAYILFTHGQVQTPTLKEYLIPKGLDRAQVVSGLNEFTSASVQYVIAQRILQQRIAEAIRVDREGWILTLKDKGEISRTNGFIDEYEAEVQRLIRIFENIDTAQKRIADLTVQRDQFTKLYAQRDQQQKDIMKKLLSARQDTEKLAKDLRGLQKQLHESLLELADAAERNFRLEAQIRGIELDYISKTKGAK